MLRCSPTGTGFAFPPFGVTLLLAAVIGLLCAPQSVLATDRTWSGGTSVWATGTNWSGGIAPGNTDNAVFSSTFSNQPTLGATATVGGLWMTGSVGQNVTIGGTFALTLNGNTINGTAGLGILVDNANAFTLTINAPITLGAAQSWTNNSANLLTIGAVSLTTKALTVTGSGNTIISGIVSSSNANGTVTKSGNGTLTLSGANTFSGQLTVASGTLSIATINNVSATGTLGNSALGVIMGSSGGVTGTLEYSGATASSTKTFALALGGTGAFQVDAAGTTLTLSGVISGSGGLQKTGAGTLTLSGANTYTGTTTVNSGTLRIGVANTLPNTAVIVSGTGSGTTATLDLNGLSDTVLSLTLGGSTATSAAVVSTGAGTLTLGGTVTYDATNNPLGATISGNLALGGTRTFSIGDSSNAANDLTVSAVVSGAGFGLTKTGAGTLTVSGLNTYTGQTLIQGGTLSVNTLTNLSSSSSLGAPTTTANGTIKIGNTTTDGTLSYTGATASTNRVVDLAGTTGGAILDASGTGGLTFSSAFTATGAGSKTLTITGSNTASNTISGAIVNNSVSNLTSVVKSGTGTWVLSGTNTYSGGTTVSGGILAVSSDANLGATTGSLTINAATLEATASFTSARAISLGNASSTFMVDPTFTFTANGIITGTGTLNKTGSGTLVLGGMNLFSGGTNVTAGTLQLAGINRLLTTADLTISGGTFDLQTFGQTTGAVTLSSGSITGSSTGILTGTSFTLQSGSVSAILAGNSTITKNTSGTVTLSGANTFTGSTTVSAGTLQVNTNNALGTAASGTTVANGAVLNLNNVNYATAEPLTLNGSGISNGGALRNTGTSTFAGPINAATNATINTGGGTLNLTGGVSKNGTTLTIAGGGTVNITTNGITGALANSDLVVDGTTVNENTANSYNGPTYIRNGGILNANVADALPTSNGRSPIIMDDSGTGNSQLTLGAPQAVDSLTGASSSLIKLNGNTLTVGSSSGTTTFAGVISGTGGLIKDGASTQIVSGANTYSGSTMVNGGTLTVANGSGNALGSTSGVTVNSGGTFLLGASDQINNTAAVTLAGGTFAKGDFSEGTTGSAGVGALTLTASGSKIDFGAGSVGVLTFASFTPGSFTLTIDNWTGTANTAGSPSTDRLIFTSDQSTNLSSFFFSGYAPGASEFNLGGGYWEVTPTAVPETSTWVAALLGLGVAAFHLIRRQRALVAVRLPKSPGNFPK